MMTRLPIKQYKTHTTLRLHGETIPTMIWQDPFKIFPVPENDRPSYTWNNLSCTIRAYAMDERA